MILGWLKGSWLWLAVIGALAVLLLGQQVQVSNAKARVARAEKAVSDEKLDRSKVNEQRSRAAMRFVEKAATDALDHATRQQELSNDLALKTRDLATADARYAALDQRMRHAASALGAALDRLDAEARAAAGEREGHRSDTFNSVAADGLRLLGQSGEVVRTCRRDLARRDAEVEALTRALANDRALLDGSASPVALMPENAPVRLKNWTAAP